MATPTPEELKRRVYTARLEQTGADLRVFLSGDFPSDADPSLGTFTGAVTMAGEITFFLGSGFDAWFGVSERLSDGTVLMMFGTIEATSTRAGIFPTLRSQELGLGEIFHYPPWSSYFDPWSFTGWCYMDRFEMLPR